MKILVVDLDGTLCELKNHPDNNRHTGKEKPIENMVYLIKQIIGTDIKVIVMTGRKDKYFDITVYWLVSQGLSIEAIMQTKEIVYERDLGRCVICGCNTMYEFHHIFFGGSAIYTENRNDPDQLCLLCHQCHTLLHFDGNSNHYREECIEYVEKYYFKRNLLCQIIHQQNHKIK